MNGAVGRKLRIRMAFIIVVILIFGLDYGIKKYVDQKYPLREQHPILKGRVVIEKFYNEGATLGLLKDRPKVMRWLHRAIIVFVSIIFGVFILQNKPQDAMTKTGLAMLLGGGSSNLWDRETKDHVVDYFWFPHKKSRKRKVIFNISDFFIFIGAVLSVLGSR